MNIATYIHLAALTTSCVLFAIWWRRSVTTGRSWRDDTRIRRCARWGLVAFEFALPFNGVLFALAATAVLYVVLQALLFAVERPNPVEPWWWRL